MSTFALRLPDSLHAHAKRLAEKDHASLNQFITIALAEKISALETADFFARTAANSKPEDFARLLKQVRPNKPIPDDELP